MNLIPNTEKSDGEITVTGIRQLATKHHKSMFGYGVPFELTSDCGQKSTIEVSARKVRDLPSAIESYQKAVAAKSVFFSGGMIVRKCMIG